MEFVTKVSFYCLFWLQPLIFYVVNTDADGGNCGFTGETEQMTVLWDMKKSGFHRELITKVRCGTGLPDDARTLIVQLLPSGVYVDPYQLERQQPNVGLQVLLDTEVDLEAPGYMSPELTAFLYPSREPGGSWHFMTALPIHARYQRPSDSGQQWELLKIEPPKLLLRSDSCKKPLNIPSDKLVEAPCTVDNTSMCSWFDIQHWKDKRAVTLEVPVGDQFLMVPVCIGTMLVTLLCCGLIAGAVRKHGFS